MATLFGDTAASVAAPSAPGFYIAIAFSADLSLADVFGLSGDFGLIVTNDRFDLLIGARINLNPIADAGAVGALRIDKNGLVGRIEARLDVDAGSSLDMSLNVYGLLEVNTTGSTVNMQVLGFKREVDLKYRLSISPMDCSFG